MSGSGRRRRWSNLYRRADRVYDSPPTRAGSSIHTVDIVEIRRRRNRLVVQKDNGVWNSRGLLQSLGDIRRMNRPLPWSSRRCRCRRWRDDRPFEPLQLGWSLNREERNSEQQAQSTSLHGEGCERGPSPTARLVPVAFECAEHLVSSETGPLSLQTPAACDLILSDERKRKQEPFTDEHF